MNFQSGLKLSVTRWAEAENTRHNAPAHKAPPLAKRHATFQNFIYFSFVVVGDLLIPNDIEANTGRTPVRQALTTLLAWNKGLS
jgi:hypothetical protein